MKRKTVTALALALALVLAPMSNQFATVVTATSNNTVVTGTGNNTNTGNTGNNTGSNINNNTGSNTGNNTGNNNNTTATGNNTYPGGSGSVGAGSSTVGTVANAQAINATATVVNSSAVSATVTTSQTNLNAAVGLTADMIAQGQTLNVVIANSQCGELARAAVNSAAAALNATVATILEIDLNIVSRNGEVLSDVTELSAPIEFVISTPAIDGNPADYDFAVARLHDGVVTILPDLDDDPTTITFATDKFSVYAVIYGEKGAFDAFRTAATKDSVPKTGSAMPSTLPLAVAGAAFAAAAVVLKKKKEA